LDGRVDAKTGTDVPALSLSHSSAAFQAYGLEDGPMCDPDARRNTVDGVRKERRGFASMSPEKQREIASKGGRAAHEKGTAHEWTPDEARNAGRKGGQISRGGRGKLVTAEPTDLTGALAPGAGGEPGRRD